MGSPVVTPKYSDLPPGAQLVHDPGQGSSAAQYSDLPVGATVVHDPSASMGPVTRFARNFDSAMGIPESVQDNPGEALTGIKLAVQHPGLLWDSLKSMGHSIVDSQSNLRDQGTQQMEQPGVVNKLGGAARVALSGVPVVGPALQHSADQIDQGDVAGGMGTFAGAVGPLVASHPVARGAIAETLSSAPGKIANSVSPRGMFANRMNQLAPDEQFTPQERYQAAKEHGVNLDLAQATESGPVKLTKSVTDSSLGGFSKFEDSQQKNVSALNDWGNQYADKLSPHSGEAAGSRVQAVLRDKLQSMKESARSDFHDLDERVGPNSIDVTKTVQAEAQKIYNENQAYYAKHPEFVPSDAWKIVKDLAGIEEPKAGKGKPAPTGPQLVDLQGNPISSGKPAAAQQVAQQSGPRMESWEDLHNLRSDTMESYRNSPDLVKSRAEGWVQRLTGKIDEAMTDQASSLSPEDKAQFRAANETWEQMKNTFDNPQHPFYHALRSPMASQSPGMMGAKAPELARQINETLGPSAGDFQRSVVEKILGRDPNGAGYDFKGMPGRLKAYSPEYLNSLLGPEASSELYKMSRVGKTVMNDENPSGSAKKGQRYGEVGAIAFGAGHGNLLPMLLPPAEFAVSHAITNPRVVDYLTQPKQPARGNIARQFGR